MSDLKFADTYNLVAFLEKPTESAGFEEIVNFLNAHTIKYALMINPTIYTSCIEQFWATTKVKTVNGDVQLQALVDGKKVIITETSVRRDLHIKDAEGTECLPTTTIFEELTRMGAKTIAWNEFSSNMASALICLATNQKFNFSKYIFDNMVKNVDSMVKFWMYPRFVQVFVNKLVGDMSHHKKIFVTHSHTKKVFGNIKREGKGFSRRITPFFPTMMVQAQEEMGEESIVDEAANEEHVPTHFNDPLLSALEIDNLKISVKKLEKKKMSRTYGLKRLYKVGLSAKVVSSNDKGLDDQENASKQRRIINNVDGDKGVTFVDETQGRNDEEMFDTGILDGEEVFAEQDVVEKEVSTTDPFTTAGEVVTTASVEVCVATTTTTTAITEVDLTLA
ncbi:hypothetical protein Tco_0110146 [Tanacetum coccineum]